MTLKIAQRLFLSMIIILSIGALVACSAVTSVPITTAIVTNTAVATKTPIPSATNTVAPEPAPTLILLPTIAFPTEAISSKNIDQIKQLDVRGLAGKPEGFFSWSLGFTPDGRTVAATHKTEIHVWDALTGQSIVTFNQSISLWNIAFSPNGKMVASFDDDGVLKLWDVQTGKEIYTLRHNDAWITIWSLAFSPDSAMLASGNFDGNIKFWDTLTGKEVNNLVDPNGSISSIAFSPDGKVLATATDFKIILWDVISKRLIRTIDFDLQVKEGFGIRKVLFSPDSKMIAAADANNIAMIWNISSGEKLGTFVGQSTFLGTSEGAIAFSPDSEMIAAGNGNNGITFWEILDNQELHTINPEKCSLIDLIFWSKGNVLEVGCDNGTILFWGLPQN